MEEIEYQATILKGVDWSSEDFVTHSWRDETSQFDEHPSKRFCGDYYDREFKARIPKGIVNCEELREAFITMMVDNFPDTEGFWVP